jgi:hypothetical protein
MLKAGMQDGKPAHWLCAKCFEQGHKSLMQFKGQDKLKDGYLGYESAYGCDGCGASFKVHPSTEPTHQRQTS